MACDLDFDIMFDAFNQRDRRAYDSMVHCWFVLLGYSNNMIQGKEAVTVAEAQMRTSDSPSLMLPVKDSETSEEVPVLQINQTTPNE